MARSTQNLCAGLPPLLRKWSGHHMTGKSCAPVTNAQTRTSRRRPSRDPLVFVGRVAVDCWRCVQRCGAVGADRSPQWL